MYYEINISKNGRHFFATAERSLRTEDEMLEVYGELAEAFPESKGYKMTVTHRMEIGEGVTILNLNGKFQVVDDKN